MLVGDQPRARLEDMVAGGDAPDRLAEPADESVIGEDEGLVDRFMHAARPRLDLRRQRLLRRGVQGLGLPRPPPAGLA